MRNAEEARKATQQQLLAMAEDCIEGNVADFIQSAIEQGEYRAICPLEGVPNAERVGTLMVDILQNNYGYCAKLIQSCEGPRYEPPCVAIYWEEKE